MAVMELSSARGLGSQLNSARILGKLGLGRSARANNAIVNEFIRRALNDGRGRRLVDAFAAYESMRRGLGSSLSWILGYEVGTAALNRIADTVNDELCAFFGGHARSGVRVMAHRKQGDRIVLEHVETPKHPETGLPRRCSLLIPAGVNSPLIGGEQVYVRQDGMRSRNGRAAFEAHSFLFTDAEGRALAGFGSIAAWFENLDDVPAALREALGSAYEEVEANAAIYDGWWNHMVSDRGGDHVRVDLGASEEGDEVRLAMDRVQTQVWHVSIEMAGVAYAPEELAVYQGIVLDPDDVLVERRRLLDSYRTCRPEDPTFAFDHIFRERSCRFPPRFRRLLEMDEDRAVSLFMQELERRFDDLRANPDSWLTTMFHDGAERELVFDGDCASTRIQLLVPLFLDDEDRDIGRPSAYLVASSNFDERTGREYLAFPTVLDGRIVQRNRNALRRAIRMKPPAA